MLPSSYIAKASSNGTRRRVKSKENIDNSNMVDRILILKDIDHSITQWQLVLKQKFLNPHSVRHLEPQFESLKWVLSTGLISVFRKNNLVL